MFKLSVSCLHVFLVRSYTVCSTAASALIQLGRVHLSALGRDFKPGVRTSIRPLFSIFFIFLPFIFRLLKCTFFSCFVFIDTCV